MRKHVFVTGEIGIGKSTAISRAVALLGVTTAGFRTLWRPAGEGRDGECVKEKCVGGISCLPDCVPEGMGLPRRVYNLSPTECLYIMPYAADSPAFAFAKRRGGGKVKSGASMSFRGSPPTSPTSPQQGSQPMPRMDTSFQAYPEILDREGPAILMRNIEQASLIVMDELGFIESEAASFRAAVTGVLAGDIPVLGVLRGRSTPFLDSIRAREDVMVIEVTKENRDAVPGWILSALGW